MFRVLAIVNGALHVRHISLDGAAASDYTGVFALAAGVAREGGGVTYEVTLAGVTLRYY